METTSGVNGKDPAADYGEAFATYDENIYVSIFYEFDYSFASCTNQTQENDYGNSGTMHESFLQTENNNEMTNSSVSDPNTPTPGWSLERVVRLVEPWKKSISESTDQIPRAKGSIKYLIVILV